MVTGTCYVVERRFRPTVDRSYKCEVRRRPLYRCYRRKSGHDTGIVKSTRLTQCMVRPCVERGFVKLGVSGLASMYPVSDWSWFLLRTIMDISARPFSLTDRPQWAIWVTSFRMRREDRSSISSYPLADL